MNCYYCDRKNPKYECEECWTKACGYCVRKYDGHCPEHHPEPEFIKTI